MTLEEFSQYIETHGAEPIKWPTESRQTADDLLLGDEAAQALLADYQTFEHKLDGFAVPGFPGLEQRVLNQNLPPRQPSLLTQLLNWLVPAERSDMHLWRPAMAACLPLVFGVVLGNYFSFGISADLSLETDEYEYWEDELTFLALSDYSESSFDE